VLPCFFVVGAQKSGTTSLHHYLSLHPEIYLPDRKETKFFVLDDRYRMGLAHYEERYFSQVGIRQMPGEVDPDYMYFPCAIERMSQHIDLSSTRFIFVLRDPVERAYSHYLMTWRRGLEPMDFASALMEEHKRISKDQLSDMHYSYFNRGLYCDQIQRFLDRTDASNTHYVLSSELKRQPLESVIGVCEFLGLKKEIVALEDTPKIHNAAVKPRSMWLLRRINSKQPGIEKKILRALTPRKIRHMLREKMLLINQTKSRIPPMNDGVRAMLYEKYEEPNRRLAMLINKDLSDWSNTLERT
jgi:Sulfotransferase domain